MSIFIANVSSQRARDVITGRLVHGHIVDEDFPSPAFSSVSGSRNHRSTFDSDDGPPDPMTQSFLSTVSSIRHDMSGEHPLGGSIDAAASSEEEEEDLRNPELETTVTMVGNVRDRPVFIVDDMIDKAASWIAAAETVVKRGGATKVYCMATHGLFGGDALRELEACECIDRIIVTNSFPISAEKSKGVEKLEVISVAPMLSEAMRRFHHGESMGNLYSAFGG
jgi:ribose-phosphate pyrophosphokinase